jgi:Fe-S-cluster-containing dehydrogenase component
VATTKLTVKIDTKLCIGAASCVSVAEKFFKMDEDNVAYLVDPVTGEEKTTITFDASPKEARDIQDAVDNCPTSAISMLR